MENITRIHNDVRDSIENTLSRAKEVEYVWKDEEMQIYTKKTKNTLHEGL